MRSETTFWSVSDFKPLSGSSYLPKDWFDYGMQAGLVLGCGAQPFGSAGRGSDWWVWAEAGRGPGGDSALTGLEEEIRLVPVVRWGRWGPPVLPLLPWGTMLLMLLMLRFGFGGLAALCVMPARPVPLHLLLLLLQVARLPVGAAPLHPVLVSNVPGLGVSWLAQGSLRAGLTILCPSCVLRRMMMRKRRMSAGAPMPTGIHVRGPAAEHRGSEQGGGGVAFGERRAHASASPPWQSRCWRMRRAETERKSRCPLFNPSPAGRRAARWRWSSSWGWSAAWCGSRRSASSHRGVGGEWGGSANFGPQLHWAAGCRTKVH